VSDWGSSVRGPGDQKTSSVRHRIRTCKQTIRIIVPQEPSRAGVDEREGRQRWWRWRPDVDVRAVPLPELKREYRVRVAAQ
jgi:hypothetical protein